MRKWTNVCASSAPAVIAGVLLVQPMVGAQQSRLPLVPAALLDRMTQDGEASYLVVIRERADLSGAENIPDRTARGRFVYEALKATASSSQRAILNVLSAEQAAGRVAERRSFFSVNAIRVTSTEATLRRIAQLPQVEQIIAAPTLSIPQPLSGSAEPAVQSIEWNIAKVRAPEVWARGFTGQGIVVANIDTGVDFVHPTLLQHYRGTADAGFAHDYSWWDATGACPFAPCDNNGHGTHTMGTMVGDDGKGNQIGVAPGASWIACKALDANGNGSLFALIECGDWVLAPWDLNGSNPDPDRRPHVVNNSWGFTTGGVSILGDMVQSWRAAGIFPAFAVGNRGPSCGTATSPGDYPTSFATGATGPNDTIASFSSRGPSVFGVIKPDVAAPGVNIRSSVPNGGYAVFSGTSMASPHTAGVVALLWSEYSNLERNIADTERKLRPAAEILNTTQGCGEDLAASHPNNTYGSGRADAVQTQNPFPIYTERSVYQPGETVTAVVSLVNAATQLWAVDAYLGVELPDGQSIILKSAPLQVPSLFKAFDVPQYSGTLSGTEPRGLYRFFMLVVVPGTDPNNPANRISIDYAPFVLP